MFESVSFLHCIQILISMSSSNVNTVRSLSVAIQFGTVSLTVSFCFSHSLLFEFLCVDLWAIMGWTQIGWAHTSSCKLGPAHWVKEPFIGLLKWIHSICDEGQRYLISYIKSFLKNNIINLLNNLYIYY